jgi:hypothetical protein
MAGAQHRSVTGMDERTLGRIDLILFDADYRDAKAALDDSWRVAVLASDPRIRTAHDRARATAVGAANARRDPSAPRVPTSTTLHRVALAVALVAGVVAVALLSTPRTSALALRDVMLPAGLLAVASAALLCWLEPRRANGSLWGSRVPAGIHVGFGGLWLLAAAAVFLFRWGEIGTVAALPAYAGLAMFVLAGLVALVLGGFAIRADRSGRQAGVARVTADLIDQGDAPEVFRALDQWWATAGPEAMQRSAARVLAVRREVLARLRAGRLITEAEERAAAHASDPDEWTERRR